MIPEEKLKKLINQSQVRTGSQTDKLILADAVNRMEKLIPQSSSRTGRSLWRIIMKSRITKLTAAAVIIIAVVLSINFWDKSIPTTSAAQVLQDAINAVSDLWSVHMKAQMRTLPRDNFSNIGLNYDFVEIEMWKRINTDGQVQWRVEKPGRVLLMDGLQTIMLIRPNRGVLEERPLPLGCFDSWSGRLLNVHDLLDNELQSAKNNLDREVRLRHEEAGGRDKTILEVEVTTYVPENDYLRNSFIQDSNHVNIYRFDTETKLLEGLQVYVHTGDEDILIFEVTDIEYNIEIDDSVFALDFPEDMIWRKEPEILPDNERYEKMTPKEAAETFFQACAEENWDEVLKFWTASRIDDRLKAYLGGLEIISLGEPFQSEGYNHLGWFVPYEIKLSPTASEFYMRLSNANSAKRFVITGMCDSKLYPVREMKWSNEPNVLPDNDAYAKMSPEDVVRTFNEAFSKEDWDEMRKFMPDFEVDGLKHGIEIWKKQSEFKEGQPFCKIAGETFWSAEHSAYFVKCRQYVESGQTKKHNLALRKDNPANRFVVDGGL